MVYLVKYGYWADIIAECESMIAAKDLDGVMVYVLKDGFCMVREKP